MFILPNGTLIGLLEKIKTSLIKNQFLSQSSYQQNFTGRSH